MDHLRWRLPIPTSMHHAAVVLALVLAAMLAVLGFASRAHAQTPPTVNGWFYGDGDDARYVEYATSEAGSKLYTYFDAQTSQLYVAEVISYDVNSTACASNKTYTQADGFPQGNARNCKKASDSEFGQFTFTCGATSYTWGQAFGCPATLGPPDTNWKTDATCNASSDTWPPDLVASTSWVGNINSYQSEYPYSSTPVPWDLYVDGTATGNWRSPYVASSPLDPTAVPGYPTFTSYDQLLAGEPSDKGWEWSMVYEWSLDISGCADNTVSFNPDISHHSPRKDGGDDNEFWPDAPTDPLSDWGDLPDSYATTSTNNGPRHRLTADGPYLGSAIDPEADGKPDANADGDNNSGADDEDGVVFLDKFVSGSTVDIRVTVTDSDGTAYLSAWIDFNGDGVLEKLELASGGFVEDLALIDGVHTLTIVVPNTTIADSLAARFRLTDEAGQGGNSTTGLADNGEVEDYIVDNTALAVTLSYFYAIRNGDTVDFVWETATEMGNAGFNLYEAVDGELRLVNPELIPSTVIDSVVPVRYTYQAQVAGEVFYIDMIDIREQSDRKGPFVLGKEYGSSSRLDVVQSLDNFIYLPLLGQ